MGIVIMRLWVTEIRDQAVTEVFGDMSTKALYGARRRTKIARRQLAPVLGVQPRRYSRRVNQITEQHSQMTPFRLDGLSLDRRPGGDWFAPR
jgi:hypothetical protein